MASRSKLRNNTVIETTEEDEESPPRRFTKTKPSEDVDNNSVDTATVKTLP